MPNNRRLRDGEHASPSSKGNRWASDAYPDRYRDDVNASIGFAGVDMDMFTRGKVEDLVKLIDRVARMPASRAECLDIGCGVGVMHPMLHGKVARLSGVDVSEDAVRDASSAHPQVNYEVQRNDRLPFADASFDVCSTVCVMHHVPPAQWRHFVAEAYRVTRPGGLFAVYEHNPINPLTRVAVWRCPFDHDAVLLRAGQTKALLREAGFEIAETRYLFFTPVDAAWARRVDGFLGWLPLGAQYVVCARKPG
ncbi:class I SAM-dependent methyltransferase [Dokdonella sp.]|uniref:class I SAM-dependent methyltransferase n=1 Tax=Dokdonella sp. TaxID=2291710 RepID=UPI0025C1DD67|nr:class I SAM-dependent methyltransferase [Dokdonella sp.]MBX3692216.1 methyltransferase domain-containing protein [Dokdonella sp.]